MKMQYSTPTCILFEMLSKDVLTLSVQADDATQKPVKIGFSDIFGIGNP